MSTKSSDKPLCLIPARGGSKRLPRKNVASLGGKPLLAWTLEAALEADLFDAVWVSSEDEGILRIAEEWGGRPLSRPPELADDRVTVVELCLQVIREFTAKGRDYSSVYVMLPTCPFRKSETIRQAWHTFLESEADALLSVVPLEHPPQWALETVDGWLKPLRPTEFETVRQELTPAYRHDGGHAIAKIPRFLELKAFLGPRTLAFPVPAEEAVDVNEPIDLAWAEFLLQRGVVQ